jgi:hypothetical protein
VAEAEGFSAQSEVLRVAGGAGAEAIAELLVPALLDPAWSAMHFDVAALLLERGVPLAMTWLEGAARDTAATPWQRVHAAALTLRYRFDDDMFGLVIDGLAKSPDLRIESRAFVRETAELAIETLGETLGDRPEDLADFVRLLRDLQEDDGEATHSIARAARAALEKVVGKDWPRTIDGYLERLER